MGKSDSLMERRAKLIDERNAVEKRIDREMARFTALSLKIGDLNAQLTVAAKGVPLLKGRPKRAARNSGKPPKGRAGAGARKGREC